ncbi:3'-5' exonuclease [Moraxella caviae]|nr:3'-5' exonuclease [Moraxella caviae]
MVSLEVNRVFKGYYMQRRSHIDQIRQQINEYLANPANASKMLYLDTETTGLGDTDQAISIAIIDEDLTVIVDTRLMTTVDINPEAQKIHKISKGDLLEYPYFVDIEHDIKRLLDGRQVGIYNADFDTRILRQSASYGMTFNFKPFCVMKEAMMLLTKNDRWLKLVDACKLTGVTLDNAHDALADAIATAKVHAVLKEMDEHIF